MRGQEGGGGEGWSRVRGRTLQPFVNCSLQPYNFATRKLLLFVDLNNKLNDPIVGSVFNIIHSGVKSYIWKFLANINSR